MGSFLCKFSASVFHGRFSAFVATLLIAIFLIPAEALAAAKPLNAVTVQDKIVKRGVNGWICVEENSGVALVGRIIAINPDSFTMQLPNDPEPVTVRYAEVIDLRTGASKGFWIATGVGIGAVAGTAVWGFVHVHNLSQQNQLPSLPSLPNPVP
jgi:Na+(H+)/acetate symporter ActP